ncbi:MAG: hypothetical protein IH921_05635 [Gemmatimonadetes bacterium]|nr:hypothetical protein [Gemmatimonadota bacterium]
MGQQGIGMVFLAEIGPARPFAGRRGRRLGDLETEAREERAAVFKSPRTWALAFAVLVAFTSPQSVPLMLHYGAQFLNLKAPAEAAELPQDEPTTAPTAPPAVPE